MEKQKVFTIKETSKLISDTVRNILTIFDKIETVQPYYGGEFLTVSVEYMNADFSRADLSKIAEKHGLIVKQVSGEAHKLLLVKPIVAHSRRYDKTIAVFYHCK